MGWLLNLFKAVVTVTATVIGVAAVVTIEIVNAASEAWGDYEEKKRKERLPEAERVKEQARDALKDVNDELLSILDKFNRRGCWSSDEKRREEYLRQRRDELKRTIDGVDEILVAKEISEESEFFENFLVDDNRAHILQGQVGVSVFGKKCPNCGRDMLIQWPRTVNTAKVTDFFWGCSGWYYTQSNGQRICSKTIKISQSDMNIFTRTDSPEYQVSNDELTELVMLPEPCSIITERMDDIVSDQRAQHRGAEDYRCPTHGEELILRKKNQATSLLDQYYLGCPRWKQNNQGCAYIVKLKSAAQLSTLLKKETGKGIL